MASATIYNVHEAKTQLSKLLERAHRGEEIILAKGGKPYAKLGPVRQAAARKPGQLKFRLGDAFFEPLPEEDLRAWSGESPA
jgi:prevent-host-death family protein